MLSNSLKMPRENVSCNVPAGWSWPSTEPNAGVSAARAQPSRSRDHTASAPRRLTWSQRRARLFYRLSSLLIQSRTGVPDHEVRDPRMLSHRLHL